MAPGWIPDLLCGPAEEARCFQVLEPDEVPAAAALAEAALQRAMLMVGPQRPGGNEPRAGLHPAALVATIALIGEMAKCSI